MTTALQRYLQAPVQRVQLGETTIAYRCFGQGPALVWVHGWPLWGVTYRELVELLEPHFRCYVPDLPGAGQSPWDPQMKDFLAGSAAHLVSFIDALGLDACALVGHDSGGTIARMAAPQLGTKLRAMVLFNTELPHHVPWLVRVLTISLSLPGAAWMLRTLLGWRWYRHSALGLGGCFYDAALLDGTFHEACIAPITRDPSGALATLRSADFSVVQRFPELHASIRAPTLCIWGARDPIFPLERARAMVDAWPNARMQVIDRAKLLVHEEAPQEAAAWMTPFLHEHLA